VAAAKKEPSYPVPTVGKGTDLCTEFPCTPDSVLVPENERTSPLYPRKFTVDIS
jgi:hypothetical protein